MTIEHKNITDSDIHLPKGFDGADNDTIPSKNSAGNLTWIDKDAVSGPQGPSGPPGSLAVFDVANAFNPVELTTISDDDFGLEVLVRQVIPGSIDIQTLYVYDEDASTIPADGLYAVNTSKGGNTRFIAGTGAFGYAGVISTASQERYISLNEIELLSKNSSTCFIGTPPALSVNGDPTKFDLSGGTILHVDNDTTPATYTKSVITPQTGISPLFLASETSSFITINSLGGIEQRAAKSSPEQRRDEATVGFLSHPDNLTIDTAVNTPQTVRDAAAQTHDIIEALGFFSTSGNQVTAKSGTLNMEKATGSGFALYENAEVNPKDPHNFNMPALDPMVMFQILRDASIVTIGAAIDPTQWDNAGVLDTVPANNNATIGYVYIFPNNQVAYLLGQQIFTTFSEAKDAAGTESVVVPTDIANSALLLARVITKKTATDLADSTESFILPSTAVSGGGSSLTSLQQAYEISVEPEIETDSTRGALTVKRGSALDTDDVFEVQNGAGTQTFSINGNGATGIGGGASSAVLTVHDNGTGLNPIANIKADDENPWALVVSNDTYSTTDTHGLKFSVGDDGNSLIYAADDGATPGELRLGVDNTNKAILDTTSARFETQAYALNNDLTDAANIATDCALSNVHTVILTATRVLDNPTNMKDGSTYIWVIKNDGVGGHDLTYGTAFKFLGGDVPSLTGTANSVDILTGVSDGTNVYCSLGGDFK